MRPYEIALGVFPFLPAFGFTPVTLREKVLAGRRLWQEWWRRRRRPRGDWWSVAADLFGS
jgi:hypothetical protein